MSIAGLRAATGIEGWFSVEDAASDESQLRRGLLGQTCLGAVAILDRWKLRKGNPCSGLVMGRNRLRVARRHGLGRLTTQLTEVAGAGLERLKDVAAKEEIKHHTLA